MGLETVSLVSDLVTSNPTGTDLESAGDDHLRNIKIGLRNTFPNASRPYAFPSTSAEIVGNVTLNETTHNNKLVPVNALAAQRTATLPTTPADGWETEVMKSDAGSNVVIITAAASINGISFASAVNQFQSVLCKYDGNANRWLARYHSPFQPYYTSGFPIALNDLGSKSTSQRIMAQGVSGSAWSSYYLGQVLDFLGTSPGDLIHHGATGWERLPASSTAGAVLKSVGSASPLVYGSPPIPAYILTVTTATITHSAIIPLDTSIPQVGEGFPLLTTSIVPTKVSSVLEVDVELFGSPATSGAFWVASLFKNGAADAVRATWQASEGPSTNDHQGMLLRLKYLSNASVLTAISFHVRSGFTSGGNIALNGGNLATSFLGGVQASYISVREIYTE